MKRSFLTAARLSSSCSTLDAPISADVTRGSRSVQAMAIWASVWPRLEAIRFSARMCFRFWSLSQLFSSDLPCAARESAGTPFR